MRSSYGYSAAKVQRRGGLALLGRLAALLACAVGLSGEIMAQSAPPRPVKLVALGDSLTAGFGLPASAAFPAQLERALRAKGHAVEIVNAGVSGDTVSGGRDRLDWSVPDDADAVIVELGANDALRGVDPAVTRAALDAIIGRLRDKKMAVLLCGMYAPRNLGAEYALKFDQIYPDLSRAHGVDLYPFFLAGVAGDPKFNIGDGLHPNADGIAEIVARIFPQVEKLIGGLAARR